MNALKRIALCALLFAFLPVGANQVVDSANRDIELPDKVQRVYAAGPPAAILTYILAPDLLIGWPRALHEEEREYIAPAYRDLPVTGRLTGRGNTANLENILRLAPDLILDFGSVNGTYVSLAERTQRQTGIPYLLIDGRFNHTAEALRLLGKAIGREQRAEHLAQYTDRLLQGIKEHLKSVPQIERPRVYMARGPNGLESGLKGSINTEIIEMAGGRNVIDPGDDANIRRGLVNLSIEQVIVADPHVIITWDREFFSQVWKNPYWANITAVRNKQVYLAPTVPFGWIDRPPSLNRLIGIKWLFGLFYPQLSQSNLSEDVREFYRLFYHVNLDDKALQRLIGWSNQAQP